MSSGGGGAGGTTLVCPVCEPAEQTGTLASAEEIQRRTLTDEITKTLRDHMLPIWQIPKTELFEACGHPALKSRKEVREVITAIWPVLAGTNGQTFIQDAAALGLYVQTERLFIID